MNYLIKKIYKSAHNFSLLNTIIFNLLYLKSFKFKTYLGKKTKFFIDNAKIDFTKPVYFDCRNGGQFWNDSKIILEPASKLKISKNVNFYSSAQIKCFRNSTISIGENTYFSGPIVLHSKKSVNIGKNCSISWNVTIIDSDFHEIGKNPIISKEIIIGNNVWIGNNVTILKGVTIGDDSIIAAGSVVTKSIASKQIFAGNPAKFLKNVEN